MWIIILFAFWVVGIILVVALNNKMAKKRKRLEQIAIVETAKNFNKHFKGDDNG